MYSRNRADTLKKDRRRGLRRTKDIYQYSALLYKKLLFSRIFSDKSVLMAKTSNNRVIKCLSLLAKVK